MMLAVEFRWPGGPWLQWGAYGAASVASDMASMISAHGYETRMRVAGGWA